MQLYPKFEFYNLNPGFNKTEEDCVIRAISGALEEDYNKIKKKLLLVAELYECEYNCICCYSYFLEDILHFKRRLPKDKYIKIKDIAQNFDRHIVLIRTNGHLTFSYYGTIRDIFNCGNEYVECFWIVK